MAWLKWPPAESRFDRARRDSQRRRGLQSAARAWVKIVPPVHESLLLWLAMQGGRAEFGWLWSYWSSHHLRICFEFRDDFGLGEALV